MNKNIILFGLILAFFGCNNADKKPKAESEMNSKDFVDLFKPTESGFLINSAKIASSNLDSFPISNNLVNNI